MKEEILLAARLKFMSDRKVICTGNPDKPFTIASGIKKKYPNATFIHKSNGWDLTDPDLEPQLRQQFSKHNFFINASYIESGIQSKLLNLCKQSVKHCDVINIGSTHEFGNAGPVDYQESKLDLINLSLSLNTARFKTCHLILGLLQNSAEPDYKRIDIDVVCDMITWVFQQPFEIPIMCIDSKKAPW
jgi:hypothetical protein